MLLLAIALAHAAPPITAVEAPLVDVAAYRARLVVLEDGQGSVVVVDPDAPGDHVFFGDRADVWQLQVVGASREGDVAFDVMALDFRARDRRAGVTFRDGAYSMSCNGAVRALRPVADARAVLEALRFHAHRWRRNAVALFRDELGVYYFVDRATGEDPDADHRVYIGWRGQVTRSPLRLLASDSLGRVWAAGNGTRRLVVTRGEARYVEGDVVRTLYPLDLVVDGPMVYGPLGVYGDAPHGTPCDVIGSP